MSKIYSDVLRNSAVARGLEVGPTQAARELKLKPTTVKHFLAEERKKTMRKVDADITLSSAAPTQKRKNAKRVTKATIKKTRANKNEKLVKLFGEHLEKMIASTQELFNGIK